MSGRAALLGLALAGALLAAQEPGLAAEAGGPAAAAACPGESQDGILGAVTPQGELALAASGPKLKLVDLRLAPPAEPAGAGPDALRLLRGFAGERLAIRLVGPADRWERRPAEVAVGTGFAAIDLAELLLGEGLAMVDAGERPALCRPDLLRIEEGARRAGRGLWRARPVLSAHDPEALRAAVGSFRLVEGRIASVGERRDRTYLNFGFDFGRDFALVLPRRTWAALKAKGFEAASLKGRPVRARGTVELGRAPSMEITAPDMLEVLGGEARRPRTEPKL